MESGIETRDLRHIRQTLSDRFDRCQVIRLMQRGKWDQFAELGQNLCIQDDRRRKVRAAVNNSMTDTQNFRAAVIGPEPPS